jgi:SM-20-related protein
LEDVVSGLEAIADRGWAVQRDFLTELEVLAWSQEAMASFRKGEFRRAGVGRGERRQLRTEVREDHIRWLQQGGQTSCEKRYFALMENLRETLNRELFLGLFGLESHLALYPAGARYRCHLDRFQDQANRIVSVSLYLNPGWRREDGGALRLYLGAPEAEPFEEVLPVGGTLVCFLSDRFHHEVLPARRERLAATGWFTRSQPIP